MDLVEFHGQEIILSLEYKFCLFIMKYIKCDNFHVRVEAIRCLEQAGLFYLELGRIAIAARHYKVHDYVDIDDNYNSLCKHLL